MMGAIVRIAVPLLLAAVGSVNTAVAGEVSVSFPNSERYTDIGTVAWESKEAMREIERHLKRLGKRYLPPRQKLTVEVLDIDLAGREEWLPRHTRWVRVLRSIAWPSMKLHYTLEENGSALADAEESISDMSYMTRGNQYYSGDRLRYDKQMLHDWFRAHFKGRRPARPTNTNSQPQPDPRP